MGTYSAARQFATWAPLAAVLIVLLPALSAAQEPVKSFDQLNTRLKPGDTLWVTDAQGREVKGKIRELHDASLSLSGDGRPAFRAADVRAIQARQLDSLMNGMIIGAASGASAAAGLLVAACVSDECASGDVAALVLIFTGAGAGIGAGIDALIPGKKIVAYRAPGPAGAPSARLSIAPVITPREKGVAVAFSF